MVCPCFLLLVAAGLGHGGVGEEGRRGQGGWFRGRPLVSVFGVDHLQFAAAAVKFTYQEWFGSGDGEVARDWGGKGKRLGGGDGLTRGVGGWMTDAPSLQDGRTPLHHAASNGHDEVVQMLLDAKADKEAKDTVRGAGDATQG